MTCRAAQAVLILLVVATAGRVVLLPPEWEPFWDGIVHTAAMFAAVLVAVLLTARAGWRNADLLMTLGLACAAFGWLSYATYWHAHPEAPFPSVPDLLGQTVYVFAVASLVVRVRTSGSQFGASFGLDGLIGAAGVAAVAAAFLMPDLPPGATRWGAVAIGAGFLAGDMVVVLLAVPVLAALRSRASPAIWGLTAAVMISAVGDWSYLNDIAGTGDFQIGGWSNLIWVGAYALMALTVGRDRVEPVNAVPTGWSALAVPLVGTLMSLGVLVSHPQSHRAEPIPWIAATAIALALLRMALLFHEVRNLAGSHELAMTDDLTALRNRRGFQVAAADMLTRHDGATLLLIDLDGFKEINDSLGHAAGDRLLVEVARRLSAAARTGGLSREPDVVGRMGGDEFAVLLPDTPTDRAETAARRLISELDTLYTVDGVLVRIEASVGIVHAPGHGTDLDELLRKADVAMYVAKAGDNATEVYRPELDTRSRTGLERVEQVRKTVAGVGLVVHYQPKIDLRTGAVVGVEALARVDDPHRGILFPEAFLPLLTQSGAVRLLTDRVLDMSLAQARVWRDAGLSLTVAVNAPVAVFTERSFPAMVEAALDRHHVPGGTLTVEVTEDVLLRDRDAGRHVIQRLQQIGVNISIDDFGTGYSSLAYLRDLPLDELKLDRSFVAGMATDRRAGEIVRSTIALAHSLGLRIVAEGVESESVRRALTECGCDQAQGYLFARPMDANELARRLTSDLRLVAVSR
jgi:diguanylate cyclase (GGDEF)-like protein